MIKVFDCKIDNHILKEICDTHFKTMVKFVVDINLIKMVDLDNSQVVAKG
ncbi:MAG: hypothetical protein H8E85_08210 [Candidatus Marinimicrobia bacterium]|nr:hypothetical protein [Candidatus Neomarinimicrobiota bacterium]